MNIKALIHTPVNSRFGWPKPKRTEEFKKLLKNPPGPTTRLVFQGKTQDIFIIRVPIDLPKYRMANGRTASLQAEYLAKNPAKKKDLFSGDSELWEAQESQHSLLLQLARQAELQQYFEDTNNEQIEPILLDESGFVINGNRRLAMWRELLFKDLKKYGHFRIIDVAVLPHCDEHEIDRLEASLQIEKDIKADYSWDARANMMLAKQKRDGFSIAYLSDLYKMKDVEVKELLDMRAYADDYLRTRGKPNMWSQVSEHEFAFRKLVTTRPKISGTGSQEVFKQAAFILIEKPEEAGQRLYDAIPAIMENLDQVRDVLQDEFEVKPPAANSKLAGMFGGTAVEGPASIEMSLAQEIQKPESADRARKIIVEVLRAQKEIKKDAKSAGYLLDSCAKAQATLAAAVKLALRPESKLVGVQKQLDEIAAHVTKISKYLKEHAKD